MAATCRKQKWNVLEFITACRRARIDGSDYPSLAPRATVALNAARFNSVASTRTRTLDLME